jgi:hypothetical protein
MAEQRLLDQIDYIYIYTQYVTDNMDNPLLCKMPKITR